jgi:NCS1 family nucleobase:cation symporter-1
MGFEVEPNSIYPIPLDQRHGRARDLFTMWFGVNVVLLTVVTGALAPTLFKLSFPASVAAILIGNLVGAVFMALHSAQGPDLGVPQMIQTRGQFGSYGSVLIIAVVVIMYVGFIASNLGTVGQSVHALPGGVSVNLAIAVVCALSLGATIFGYDIIHAYARLLSWLSGGAMLVCFAWAIFVHGVPAGALAGGRFSPAGFFGVISTTALWQISYAPYVSDYSRYLPPGTGAPEAFWASYLGTVLGSVIPMIFGALLVIVAGAGDVGAALIQVLGPVSTPVILVFTFAIASGNALNLYCGALAALTVVQTFWPRWRITTRDRIIVTILLGAAALALGLLSAGSFLQAYTDFLQLLLCVLTPWTAINLVDYYLVRHGAYEVAAFFEPDGGCYGRFNWPALACYGLGVGVQAPFVVTDFYTGPAAKLLGHVDLSWIVGLFVVAPAYYWLAMRPPAAGA